MACKRERYGVILVGFEAQKAQALAEVAARLNWYATVVDGTLDTIPNLPEEQTFLMVIDIGGTEIYGPAFISALRKAGVRSAVVSVGEIVPRALEDQLVCAGADLVMNTSALFNNLACCSDPKRTKSLIEACGPEKFVQVEIARKRHLGKLHSGDVALGAR